MPGPTITSGTGTVFACPACGEEHRVYDVADAWPPGPYSAWPERYGIDNEEGGVRLECWCGEWLGHDEIMAITGLPDFPWRVAA